MTKEDVSKFVAGVDEMKRKPKQDADKIERERAQIRAIIIETRAYMEEKLAPEFLDKNTIVGGLKSAFRNTEFQRRVAFWDGAWNIDPDRAIKFGEWYLSVNHSYTDRGKRYFKIQVGKLGTPQAR